MPLAVLLTTTPENPASDLHQSLSEAGYAVRDHALGSTPPVDFAMILVAVLEVGTRVDAAIAQTRRWRAELGDELLPVTWVLPTPSMELVAAGLDAGADVVLTRPLEPETFLAQIRAAARTRISAGRLATRAAEARLLGEQLQKAYAQLDRELHAARRVHRAFLPQTLPAVGSARFAVSHRPRSLMGGDFYDVRVVDPNRIGFFLGDVIGTGGSLLGVFVSQSVAMKETDTNGTNVRAPGDVLAGVNRQLLGLRLEETPLVAMLCGSLDVRTGALSIARAGLPAPVHVPAGGEPRAWTIPGPFLGTADTSYCTHQAHLRPGDKLVLGTDGTRPDGDPGPGGDGHLLQAISRHRALTGQGFVDAVAQDLLTSVRHPEDFTLLCVEMSGP